MSSQRRILPPRKDRLEADTSLAIVNIVLLLLFFFLATGALVGESDRGVNISETVDLPIDQLPRPILIVAEDGSLTLDGAPVARELIAQALDGATVLHVLIDRDAPATELLELLSEPGLDTLDIQLVTLHRRGES